MSQTSRGGDTAPPSTAALPTPKERRRLREALSLSEEQVAESMGVTKATVKAWETGRSTPRGRKREAYAKLLAGPAAEPAAGPEAGSAAGPRAGAVASPKAGPAAGPQAGSAAGPQAGSAAGAAVGTAASPKAGPAAGTKAGAAASPQAGAAAGPKAGKTAIAKAGAVAGPKAGPTPAPAANVRPKASPKRAPKPPRVLPATANASAPGRRLKPGPEPKPAAEKEPTPAPAPARLTPEEAFDALYGHAAPGLVHQTYLLTGRRRLSRESVEHAFHHAWEHWPEVATDADPVGWVRAAAYEYALSPWHRLRRAHKHPDAPPTEAGRRALLGALLDLPAPYRRTVLLYDGLGLDLPETAAETEASTPAAANRLMYAHAAIGERLPELADPEALQRRLTELVAEAPTATLPGARAVRSGSERRIRRMTRAVLGVTAVLIGVTALTAVTAPTRYIPDVAPGQTVNGVPVRGGPQKLGEEDVELRDRLRSEPNPGPERLIPAAR
ncbi:helix-turn-helix domain-containing protein [Streptomyces sp. NPDC058486]|uniref:helix-turn-helix domain-containing protein n=1 Tax=unclassified Streptomyces TaxID=2593676 RepID=UPI003664EF67